MPTAKKSTSYRRQRLKRYGLTEETYFTILQTQNFVCKICGVPEANPDDNLSVDHCHRTGRVRGLLCKACNSMLGQADDNPTILLKAIQYLKGNLK